MPCLSIIIPHRGDNVRLETTLLSVLENRPRDCEIIVAHDGSYPNPYALQDEVVFVVADPGSGPLKLINEALHAARAPIVNTVIDGTVIPANWERTPLQVMHEDRQCATVSVAIEDHGQLTYGLDLERLRNPNLLRRQRRLAAQASASGGAQVVCGFYRRKVLLSLGGFDTGLGMEAADADIAWALAALELSTTCASDTRVQLAPGTGARTASLSQLARRAAGYGLVERGAKQALQSFCHGLASGRIRSAWSWSAGLVGANDQSHCTQRLAEARRRIEADVQPELRLFTGADSSRRRAA